MRTETQVEEYRVVCPGGYVAPDGYVRTLDDARDTREHFDRIHDGARCGRGAHYIIRCELVEVT